MPTSEKLLIKLGFERWTPHEGDFPDFKSPRPTYITGGPTDETYVIDEAGVHWKTTEKHDWKALGFDSLLDCVKQEIKQKQH